MIEAISIFTHNMINLLRGEAMGPDEFAMVLNMMFQGFS